MPYSVPRSSNLNFYKFTPHSNQTHMWETPVFSLLNWMFGFGKPYQHYHHHDCKRKDNKDNNDFYKTYSNPYFNPYEISSDNNNKVKKSPARSTRRKNSRAKRSSIGLSSSYDSNKIWKIKTNDGEVSVYQIGKGNVVKASDGKYYKVGNNDEFIEVTQDEALDTIKSKMNDDNFYKTGDGLTYHKKQNGDVELANGLCDGKLYDKGKPATAVEDGKYYISGEEKKAVELAKTNKGLENIILIDGELYEKTLAELKIINPNSNNTKKNTYIRDKIRIEVFPSEDKILIQESIISDQPLQNNTSALGGDLKKSSTLIIPKADDSVQYFYHENGALMRKIVNVAGSTITTKYREGFYMNGGKNINDGPSKQDLYGSIWTYTYKSEKQSKTLIGLTELRPDGSKTEYKRDENGKWKWTVETSVNLSEGMVYFRDPSSPEVITRKEKLSADEIKIICSKLKKETEVDKNGNETTTIYNVDGTKIKTEKYKVDGKTYIDILEYDNNWNMIKKTRGS